MKIGIVGAGQVGATLGKRFAAIGHQVVYGARNPGSADMATLLATHPGYAAAVRVDELAARCEVVFLAVPWMQVENAVAALGDLGGKILVDCTNPIGPDFTLALGTTDSGGEFVARLATNARVVKAFNTIGYEVMADPSFASGAAALTVCGDDPAAVAVASGLGAEIGFVPVSAGPLATARLTEPMAMLWINLALMRGLGRQFAFGLLDER